MAQRHHLRALAQRYGILASYVDQQGRRRDTADDTSVALLAAMGIDASTEARARARIAADDRIAATKLIEPVVVTTRTPTALTLDTRAVGDASRPISWELDVSSDDGTTAHRAGRGVKLPLPRLALGYHRLHVHAARSRGRDIEATQTLIVVPKRCVTTHDVIDDQRVFGLLANLYTLRSQRNWGVGDFGDLEELIRWSGDVGAAFVGVNPLHALENTTTRISPYNPVSRLFRNVIYLDVERLPELEQSPAAQQRLASPAVQTRLNALRATARVDYEGTLALKLSILRPLYRSFVKEHRVADTARGRAYRSYCQAQGRALNDFATFAVLRQHWQRNGCGTDWHDWPAAYRHPRSRAVDVLRGHYADEIGFFCYLQFALDEQLAQVAAAARRHGVPLGVYQDLAIGSAGDGSDTWAFPELFVDGVSVGAPPDNYNANGQNWSFPPLDPRRLRASGYDYFVRLLRAGLRHAGALRIDHILGFVRQYWIPAGAPADTGAYVRVASEDLFGIVALESHRAGALIVGEDLGTLPPELPDLLRRWGVLSTRVFYFERSSRGSYRPAKSYPSRALVSANTHDLPPILGFLEGDDLTQRAALGLLSPDHIDRARHERARDVSAMQRRLFGPKTAVRRRVAPRIVGDAIHRYLAQTPAALFGIGLDDLGGEREPVNVPGVSVEQHPSWSRRMRRSLRSLRADASVTGFLRSLRQRRWKKAHRPR